jgi:hypothetical protein
MQAYLIYETQMIRILAGFSCVLLLFLFATDEAEARRGGRFVSGMARGMAHSGIGSKTYGADVLTVPQLTDCVKRADNLDSESISIETNRTLVSAKVSQVDLLKSDLERLQITLDRYSQNAIDRFNAMVSNYNVLVGEARSTQASFNQHVQQHNESVNSYNALCAKRYYADDLKTAKRYIGLD